MMINAPIITSHHHNIITSHPSYHHTTSYHLITNISHHHITSSYHITSYHHHITSSISLYPLTSGTGTLLVDEARRCNGSSPRSVARRHHSAHAAAGSHLPRLVKRWIIHHRYIERGGGHHTCWVSLNHSLYHCR